MRVIRRTSEERYYDSELPMEGVWERIKVLLGVFFTFAFATVDVMIFVSYFSR